MFLLKRFCNRNLYLILFYILLCLFMIYIIYCIKNLSKNLQVLIENTGIIDEKSVDIPLSVHELFQNQSHVEEFQDQSQENPEYNVDTDEDSVSKYSDDIYLVENDEITNELQALSLKELKEKAESMNLKFSTKVTKKKIVELIRNNLS
jgi:hypothetical protein